jgi:hypothetical protein
MKHDLLLLNIHLSLDSSDPDGNAPSKIMKGGRMVPPPEEHTITVACPGNFTCFWYVLFAPRLANTFPLYVKIDAAEKLFSVSALESRSTYVSTSPCVSSLLPGSMMSGVRKVRTGCPFKKPLNHLLLGSFSILNGVCRWRLTTTPFMMHRNVGLVSGNPLSLM